MKDLMLKTWIRFQHDEDGATLVEYGIALLVAILIGATALTQLATDVGGNMGDASSALTARPSS